MLTGHRVEASAMGDAGSGVRVKPMAVEAMRYDSDSRVMNNDRFSKVRSRKAHKEKQEAVKAGHLPGNRGEDNIDSLIAFIGGDVNSGKAAGDQNAAGGKAGKNKKKQSRNVADGSECTEHKSEDVTTAAVGVERKSRNNSTNSLPEDKPTSSSCVKDAVASKKSSRKQSLPKEKQGDELLDSENAVGESTDFVVVSKKKKNSPEKRSKDVPSPTSTNSTSGGNVKLAAVVSNAKDSGARKNIASLGTKSQRDDEGSGDLSFPPLSSANRCSSTGDVSVVVATSRDESDRDSVASVPSGVGAGVSPGLLTYALAIARGEKTVGDAASVAVSQVRVDSKSPPKCVVREADRGKELKLTNTDASAAASGNVDPDALLSCSDDVAMATAVSDRVTNQPAKSLVATAASDISFTQPPVSMLQTMKKPPSVVFLNEPFMSELPNPHGISFGFDDEPSDGAITSVGEGEAGGGYDVETPVSERDVSEEFERKCRMDDSGTGSVDGSDIADEAKPLELLSASIGAVASSNNPQAMYLDDSAVIAASGYGRRIIPDMAMLNPTYNYLKTVSFLLGGNNNNNNSSNDLYV